MIIPWQSLSTWNFLKIAKAFVKSNPDDQINKRVYRNLIRSYARGN